MWISREGKFLANECRAVHQYVIGNIEIDELERALEHIYANGVGNADFPYLLAFELGITERA